MLVKNVSEMQDLDKPCILLQIRSELDEKWELSRCENIKTASLGAAILNI